MFKKLLCWLLIFQHINVYVLHASAGDFSISFSREDGELHSPKLIKSQVPRLGKARVPGRPVFSLKLQRELESGGYESLYNISYLFTEGKFKEEKVGRRALVQTLSLTEGKYLGIISSNPEQSFSLYLYPDGRAHLQGLKSSRHLEVQTFGDLVLSSGQRDTQGKVRSLALTAANISNERRLFVEELTLRTLEASGTITNTQGAHLEIGKSACVQRGRFENQGWFHAHNGSVLNLEGNDFLNNRRFKNVRLSWEGNFSIQNVRNFQNTADMMPQGLHENDRPSPHSNRPSSLSIATQSFSNGGNILATQNVSIACLEDFENSGRIWAQDVLLKLGRDFRNQGWINASSLLKIRVERDFYNNQSGRLEAPRLDISVGGVAWNSGKLTSHRLILAARILQNFGIVSLAKRGSVEAREFYNHKGARLVSEGSLTLRGGVFHNLGDAETKGYIHARSLVTRLTVLKNEGELLAHKKVNLHAASLQNGETGILRLTKGKIFAHVLYNKGAVSGVTLNGVIHTLENFGQFMFSKFKVALHFLFSNTKGALFSTSRRFIASGEGDFHNSGFLKSEGSTDIQVATLTNVGEISSEKTLSIKTREGSREDNADLENRGLIE